MASLLKIIAVALMGALLGLLMTIYALDRDNRGTRVGAWRGTPQDGAADADPYALASIARAGLLPPGASEGVSFLAKTDDRGALLSPSCDYRVIVKTPAARYWTLSLLSPEGFPRANPAGRYVFTSADILRDQDDPPGITVSAEARAGNWLPAGRGGPFVLMLRLYDSTLTAAGAAFDTASLPAIEKTACR